MLYRRSSACLGMVLSALCLVITACGKPKCRSTAHLAIMRIPAAGEVTSGTEDAALGMLVVACGGENARLTWSTKDAKIAKLVTHTRDHTGAEEVVEEEVALSGNREFVVERDQSFQLLTEGERGCADDHSVFAHCFAVMPGEEERITAVFTGPEKPPEPLLWEYQSTNLMYSPKMRVHLVTLTEGAVVLWNTTWQFTHSGDETVSFNLVGANSSPPTVPFKLAGTYHLVPLGAPNDLIDINESYQIGVTMAVKCE